MAFETTGSRICLPICLPVCSHLAMRKLTRTETWTETSSFLPPPSFSAAFLGLRLISGH